MKLFYCKNLLVSVVENAGATSLFRSTHLPLASVHDNRRYLLGVDDSNSVLSSCSPFAVTTVSYGPYGSPSSDRSTTLGFNGAYLDSFTGQYPLGNGYRFYAPSTMRFCAPDNVSPFGAGGINGYSYTYGDPINRSDPSGHFAWTKLFSLFGNAYVGRGKKIDGIRVFVSDHPDVAGRKLLNIQSHGAPGLILGKAKGYTPKMLKEALIASDVEFMGMETHVLACYSAATLPSGESSFITQWANITGARTYGYANGVPSMRSSDGPHHHAVVLPVLPGFQQLLKQSSNRVTAMPSETGEAIRDLTRPAGPNAAGTARSSRGRRH